MKDWVTVGVELSIVVAVVVGLVQIGVVVSVAVEVIGGFGVEV